MVKVKEKKFVKSPGRLKTTADRIAYGKYSPRRLIPGTLPKNPVPSRLYSRAWNAYEAAFDKEFEEISKEIKKKLNQQDKSFTSEEIQQFRGFKKDFKKAVLEDTEQSVDSLRTVQRNWGQTGAENVRRALNSLGAFFPDLPPTFRLSALRQRKYCPSMDDVKQGIEAVFSQRKAAIEAQRAKYVKQLEDLQDKLGEDDWKALTERMNKWCEEQQEALDDLKKIYEQNATRWHLRTQFRMRKIGGDRQSIGLSDYKPGDLSEGTTLIRYRSRLRLGKAAKSISVTIGKDSVDVEIHHHRLFRRDLNKKDIHFMLQACRAAGRTTITPTGFNLSRRREIVREALKAGFTVAPTTEDAQDRVIGSLIEDFEKARGKYQARAGVKEPTPAPTPTKVQGKSAPSLRPADTEME